jgi:hypothetical protein
MWRPLGLTLLCLCLVSGCSDPSDPSNAPPGYPDMSDPKNVMGGSTGPKVEAAPTTPGAPPPGKSP